MQHSHEEQYDFLYKLVLVGDMNVGKTFLLSRYVKGQVPKNTGPTIGVEFATKTVSLPSGGTVKAQIWDTAGQERYRAITTAHYRRALGALLVYDITQEKTFANVKKWMEELRDHADPDIVIMLVGNKVDLVEAAPAERQVPTEAAERLAQEQGLLFSETSAVKGTQVREAFETLLSEISKRRSADPSISKSFGEGAHLRMQDSKKEGCC
jgi:Rab family protein